MPNPAPRRSASTVRGSLSSRTTKTAVASPRPNIAFQLSRGPKPIVPMASAAITASTSAKRRKSQRPVGMLSGELRMQETRERDELAHEASTADHDERAVPGREHDGHTRQRLRLRANAVERALHRVGNERSARRIADDASQESCETIELLDAIDLERRGGDAR